MFRLCGNHPHHIHGWNSNSSLQSVLFDFGIVVVEHIVARLVRKRGFGFTFVVVFCLVTGVVPVRCCDLRGPVVFVSEFDIACLEWAVYDFYIVG